MIKSLRTAARNIRVNDMLFDEETQEWAQVTAVSPDEFGEFGLMRFTLETGTVTARGPFQSVDIARDER